MLYYLFNFLDTLNFPGAGLFGFIPDTYETPSVRWDTTNTL